MALAITEPTVEVASTSNTTSYAMGAFTPTANSFLVCMVFASGTVAAGSMSGGGLTWSRQTSINFNSTDTAYLFTAPVGASPASTTPTFDCTGDAATGSVMMIWQVTGTNVGVVQVDAEARTAANPTITMPSALSTGNAYMAGFGMPRSPPSSTPPNVNWTEIADVGYSTPTSGASGAHRVNGETGSTITFTSASAAYGILAIEVAELPATGTLTKTLGDVTSSSAGAVKVTGAAAKTLADLTMSGTGGDISATLGSRLYRWYKDYTTGTWTDTKGGSNATQATGTAQPTVLNTTGGQSYPDFDGGDQLQSTQIASLPAYNGATQHFIWGCLIRVDTAGVARFIWGTDDYNTYVTDTGIISVAGTASNASAADGVWRRLIVVRNATTGICTQYINGVAQTTTSVTGFGSDWKTSTAQTYGDRPGGGFPLDGGLGAMFWGMDTTAFAAGDITQLDSDLQSILEGGGAGAGAGKVTVSGTLAKTLDAATLSSAGTSGGVAGINGTLTQTLSAVTSSSAGALPIAGTATKTLDTATLASAGGVAVVATLTKTLTDATLTSAGGVAVVGSTTATLGVATVNSAAGVKVSGTASPTLDTLTGTAAGTVKVSGVATPTLGAVMSSSAGTVAIVGAGVTTLGAATLASAGGVAVVGSASNTLSALTSSSAGTVKVTGVSTPTLGTLTSSSAGTVAIAGALSKTLDAATLSATSGSGVVGSVTASLGAATLGAAGTLPVVGAAINTLGAATLSAAGGVRVQGALSATLGDVTSSSAGGVRVTGAASNTLGSVSLFSQGGAPVAVMSLAATLGAVAASSAGVLPIAGSTAKTLASCTSVSIGTVAVVGSVAATLADVTLASAAAARVAGTCSATLGSLSLASAASVRVTGTANITLDTVTLVTSNAIKAELDATLDPLTVSSSGTVPIFGTATCTLDGAFRQLAAVMNPTLRGGIVTSQPRGGALTKHDPSAAITPVAAPVAALDDPNT